MIITATGFDLYPSLDDLVSEGWTSYGGSPATLNESNVCSVHSRQSLRSASSTQTYTPSWPVQNTIHTYWAFWFMFDYVPTADRSFLIQMNEIGGQENFFKITTSYEIKITNPLSSQLGISSTNVLTKDVWHYIEIKWTVKGSIAADDCIVKVDGNEVINLSATTDTDYSSKLCAMLNFYGPNQASAYHYYDDFIYYTSEGSDWTDFKGPRYISTLKPNGNGNYSQWTRSGGSNNYETLDDDEFNDDTSYVSTSTLSNKDSYAFENLHSSVNSVDAVQTVLIGKKSAGDNYRTVMPFARISSTDYENDYPHTLSDEDYRPGKRILYESPATSTAWTPAEINGAEFGIKVET